MSKPEKFVVRDMSSGEPADVTVTGYAQPGGVFMVRKKDGKPNRWVVYHLPTGLTCGGSGTKAGAERLAAAMSALGDWSKVRPRESDRSRLVCDDYTKDLLRRAYHLARQTW